MARRQAELSVAARRRLPVLNTPPPEDEERPPWQWAVGGAALSLTLWLPIAGVLAVSTRRSLEEGASTQTALALAGLHLAGFAVAALIGGVVVGRWSPGEGTREASVGGALAATLGFALAGVAAPTAFMTLTLAFLLVGVGWAAGRLGGRLGRASKRRG